MDDTARRASGLPLLSVLCVGLLAGGLAVGVGIGGVMPLPYGPVAAVAAYVRAEPDAVRVIAVATFASSVPLALYAATAAARLRRLGPARRPPRSRSPAEPWRPDCSPWPDCSAGRCPGRRSPRTRRWWRRCTCWCFSPAGRGTSWRWACWSPRWRCPA